MKTWIGTSAWLATSVVALLATQRADASGFAIRENSAVGLGSAFSGNASSAQDLATIFTNPAGMSYFQGNQAEASGSLILPHTTFSGSSTSSVTAANPLPPPAFVPVGTFPTGGSNNGSGSSIAQTAFIPAAYAMMDFGNWKAGLAITAPFGLVTDYADDFQGRYLGIRSSVMSVDVNPNVAYKVNNWLSVGGGISVQYFSGDFTQLINISGLVGAPPNTVLPDGRARVFGNDVGVGYNFGVIAEPMEGTRVGLTYRSRIQHTLDGNVDFSVPAAVAANPAFRSAHAQASLTTPMNASIGLTQVISPQWTVSAEAEWTGWSSFSDLAFRRSDDGSVISDQPQNYRDTWFLSLGANYKYDDHWSFRGGVAWDQSPVRQNFLTVRLPDNDRYWVSLGLGYDFGNGIKLDAGYAHLFVSNPSISGSVNAISAEPNLLGGFTASTLSGNYSASIDIISAQVRFGF